MKKEELGQESISACCHGVANCYAKNIVSFSGGKDSTAMLHAMLDRGEDIHSVVFFDTGWEFPELLNHINLVEKKTGFEIIRVKPDKSFDYLMFKHKAVSRKKSDFHKSRVYYGYGWPSFLFRWCTGEKVSTLNRYIKKIGGGTVCVGIAYDEVKRIRNKRYPLVEYGMTEKDCLEYCKSLGYTWDGLYDVFDRVSCFCCPLKSNRELKMLRKYYPDLWKRMLDMDSKQPSHNNGFKSGLSVSEWDKIFHKIDKQGYLFGVA